MFLGSETFDDYFKFTVIRNPFDRAISIFYFAKNIENNLRHIIAPRWRFKFKISENASDVDLFKRWVTRYENSPQNYLTDRKMYTIDNEVCMDYLIRFENLEEGIHHVCVKDLPYSLTQSVYRNLNLIIANGYIILSFTRIGKYR